MGFSGQKLDITNLGLELSAKTKTGTRMRITRFGFGSGSLSGQAPELLTNMIAPECYKNVGNVARSGEKLMCTGVLSREDLTKEFLWREFALFAMDMDADQEVMYAYGNCGSAAQSLSPANMDDQVLRVPLVVSNAANVTFEGSSGVYVTYGDLEAHMEDDENPHKVTAAQVGARPDTWTPTADQVGASQKPVILTGTLTAEGWSGSAAPYTQTLTITGIPASQDAAVFVSIAPTSTAAQMEVWGACMVMATGHAQNSITFSAMGDKPEADLPVQITVLA